MIGLAIAGPKAMQRLLTPEQEKKRQETKEESSPSPVGKTP
jgi:hypothetical protein